MTTYDIAELCGRHSRNHYGHYKCKCPCNCSRKYSLHLKALDGKTLIYCESGCNAEDIVKALGINLRDLYDEKNMSWHTEARVHR